MKTDKFDDYAYEAFNNLDTEITDLRTIAWMMECVANSADCLPKGMHRVDLDYLLAKLIARQAERMSDISRPAQELLHQRRQSSR